MLKHRPVATSSAWPNHPAEAALDASVLRRVHAGEMKNARPGIPVTIHFHASCDDAGREITQ